jgi:DNA-binding CsgD family transcriptional regulator
MNSKRYGLKGTTVLTDLTPREREFMQTLIKYEGNLDKVAARLGIKNQSARQYMRNVTPKLGASGRNAMTQCVLRFMKLTSGERIDD